MRAVDASTAVLIQHTGGRDASDRVLFWRRWMFIGMHWVASVGI